MKDFRTRAVLALTSLLLVAASCSSGGEQPSVEAAQTSAAPTTAAPPTTAAEPDRTTSTTTTEPANGQMIQIDGAVEISDERGNSSGTFKVTAGSEFLGCESGTFDEYPTPEFFVDHMTCASGSRTGTFMMGFAPTGGPINFSASWNLIIATGDYGDISGSGDWRGRLSDDEESGTWTMTGEIEFGEVTKPLATFPRLVQARSSDCQEGMLTIDGLYEFATVGDEMLRLDFATGEVTEHGASPAECAFWLGDEKFGRRVATTGNAESETKIWLGPFDGPWDVELEFDELTILLSRSFAANRLIFSQPDSGSVFLMDATTGEQVGPAVSGGFDNGRQFSPTATSDDGSLIAVGGADPAAGGGLVFVLDAETGEEVFQMKTGSPVTTFDFDDAAGELVAGLFSRELITIDLSAGEVVAKVETGRTATIDSIGIRPDGLVVVYTAGLGQLIDRHTGPTGATANFRYASTTARIQPDGTIAALSDSQQMEIVEIDG